MKISIIVPIYRVEKYIHRCIDSILCQTFSDFELILVDDGSPDNCGTICDEYAARDDRIVVIHQENGGLSAARNTGIDWAFANSDSEWLTFVDSDDYIHPEYLDLLLSANAVWDTNISVCNATISDFSNTKDMFIPQKYAPETVYCDDLLRRNIIFAWGKLYRKSLWQNIRFPVGKIHEDRFTTHRLLFQCPEIAYIEGSLYHYTLNPAGISRSTWTLKRLDDLEALGEQYRFFQQKGFENAFHRTARSALNMIPEMIGHINELSIPSSEKRKYLHRLRKKLRFFLKKHKVALNITMQSYCHSYEAAYPFRMKLYWYYQALLRKFHIK